ncbi:MAG: Fic family protein, partial [Polaromonas sp.]
MLGRRVGYEFLRSHLALSAFPCERPARISSVTKILQRPDGLEVPAAVAPDSQAPLAHILFALKHEGINLQILAQSLPQVPALQIIEAFRNSPASKYIRMAAYLWEQFADRELEGVPSAIGPYVALIDAKKYLTGRRQRNTKWRVDFNGLGSIRYCPTVERTSLITELLEKDTLQRAREFIEGLDPELLERTMSWSYLSETESSFAIESEKPSTSKAQAFAELLQQAHGSAPVTEDYLVELQNLAVTNPLDHDAQFRTLQNWLRGPGRGVLGITYVPPAPGLLPELMQAIMDLVNEPPPGQSPLVMGALASFAFVFVHPFMDGNGRL